MSTQAPSPLWFFARAGGFVSLILLTLVVALGIALTLRWRSPDWPTFINDGLHRYLSTLLFVFLGIHVGTILLDPFTHFSLGDVLVPFASHYRPLWMGLGICAMELAVALALSVHLRRRVGYRLWRVMHYATQAIFPMALLHGVGTGTDTHSLWAIALYLGCGGLVAGLIVLRVSGGAASQVAATSLKTDELPQGRIRKEGERRAYG